MCSVRHATSIVIVMTSEEEKLKALVKFCYSYYKSGRIGPCAKIIGRSLAECSCTIDDIKVAKLLLRILEGDIDVK